jgi:O-acetyl-ADP-ribose deacetylase (regulator of RNase III)
MLLSTKSLLDAKEDIIVHQVNCQGKMNSGIAKQIRERWPEVYNNYMGFWSSREDKSSLLGNVQIVEVSPDKFVVNLFGQEHYGYDGRRYTSYDALYEGLLCIKNMAQKYNKSIAIPFKIGCERGGADWFIVDAIIQRIFHDYEVHLYKWEEN